MVWGQWVMVWRVKGVMQVLPSYFPNLQTPPLMCVGLLQWIRPWQHGSFSSSSFFFLVLQVFFILFFLHIHLCFTFNLFLTCCLSFSFLLSLFFFYSVRTPPPPPFLCFLPCYFFWLYFSIHSSILLSFLYFLFVFCHYISINIFMPFLPLVNSPLYIFFKPFIYLLHNFFFHISFILFLQ